MRNKSLENQREYNTEINSKGNMLIDLKKLAEEGHKELLQIVQSKFVTKLDKKLQSNARDQYLSTCKYNYDMPPMIIWNEIELKLSLEKLAKMFKVEGNMEIDNGHSFSYNAIVFFPQNFQI